MRYASILPSALLIAVLIGIAGAQAVPLSVASFSLNRTNAATSSPVEAHVQINGGTPPYKIFSAYGSSPRCINDTTVNLINVTNSSSFYYRTTVNGSGYYCAIVFDSAMPANNYNFSDTVYVTATNAEPTTTTTISTTVSSTTTTAPLYASISITPLTVSIGQTVLTSVRISGGIAPYSVTFMHSASSTCSSQAESGITQSTDLPIFNYSDTVGIGAPSGYYCAEVADSLGHTSYTNTEYITILSSNSSPLSASFSVHPDSLNVGQYAALSVRIYGGIPPYTVQFESGISPTCADNSKTLAPVSTPFSSVNDSERVTEPGSGYFCANVTDATGHSAYTNSVYVSATSANSTAPPNPPNLTRNSGWQFSIKKGWNLIPFYGVSGTEVVNNCGLSSTSQLFDSIFIYDSASNSYFSGASIANESNPGYGWWHSSLGYVSSSTGWFYSPTDCQASFGVLNTYPAPMGLIQGWNFMTVMPWMLNQTYQNVFSNCNVQRVYGWVNSTWTQRYANISAFMVGRGLASSYSQEITPSQVGTSMLLYASNACSLSSSGSGTVTPPSPPGNT